MKLMTLTLTLAVALAGAAPDALANTADQSNTMAIKDKSQGLFQNIAYVLVKFIFPVMSLVSLLYGLWNGIRNGRWDMAVVCVIASLALAVLPNIVLGIFNGVSVDLK